MKESKLLSILDHDLVYFWITCKYNFQSLLARMFPMQKLKTIKTEYNFHHSGRQKIFQFHRKKDKIWNYQPNTKAITEIGKNGLWPYGNHFKKIFSHEKERCHKQDRKKINTDILFRFTYYRNTKTTGLPSSKKCEKSNIDKIL